MNINDSFYLVTFHLCLGHVPGLGLEVKGSCQKINKNDFLSIYPELLSVETVMHKFHSNLWSGHFKLNISMKKLNSQSLANSLKVI